MNSRPDPARARRIGIARVAPVVTLTTVGATAVTVAVAGGLAVASARTRPVTSGAGTSSTSSPSTGRAEGGDGRAATTPGDRSGPVQIQPGTGGGPPDAQSQAS